MATNPLVPVGNLVAFITATTPAPQYMLRFTVPKRRLGASRRLRGLMDGTITTGMALALNITITVVFGTQTLTAVTAFPLGLGLVSRMYKIVVLITADDAMATQSVSVDFYETVTNQNVFTIRPFQGSFSQPVATTDTEFAIKVAFSGVTTGASMTRHMSVVEIVG